MNRGDPMTVVVRGRVFYARFLSIIRGMPHCLTWRSVLDLPQTGWAGVEHEGLTWCRGWTAEAIDAVVVAEALSPHIAGADYVLASQQ